MTHRHVAMLAAGLLAAAPAAAAAQSWTAAARDDGMAVPCRTAADPASYRQALARAGWSKYGRAAPAIDFARSFAVIVAPGHFRPDADLVFVDKATGGGRRTLRWRFADRAQVAQRLEQAHLFGSAGPAGKEILVVAYPRAALGLRQSCTGIY